MSILNGLVVGLYILGLTAIFIYTLAQANLAWKYLKSGHKKPAPDWSDKPRRQFPAVTVQLPIYNEKYVVKRLIEAVASFTWPAEKLEIQVLDDSTDETVEIIADKVSKLQREGVNIHHLRRDSREGYKAGALQYGMERSEGEFIAIFDADFVPEPDFLMKTVPHFEDPKIGLVQTRWGHLNEDYSLLTKVQAFALNAHFTVEQTGRNSAGYFMNFNGTAGIWRRACIEDAGGWHHDTLTEDLDLSYRAQLKDWNFRYLEEVVTPAELPATVSALKGQQYRWMKGAAETARKHLPHIWKADLPLITKFQATSHLLNSSIFVFILLISVASLPLLFLSIGGELNMSLKFLSFFLSGLLLWILFYSLPLLRQKESPTQKIWRFIKLFPAFLALSMAFSVHNTMAVLKGYAGKSSPFIRTPKFNITGYSDSWKNNTYLVTDLTPATLSEGALSVFFLAAIVVALFTGSYSMIAFHLLLFGGFGTLVVHSLYEKIARQI